MKIARNGNDRREFQHGSYVKVRQKGFIEGRPTYIPVREYPETSLASTYRKSNTETKQAK